MAKFRDRFFTPKVARAMLSPSGIVLAGGAAAVAIVAGGGLLAVPAAVVAWGARVFAAIPKNARTARIDPFVLSEPWRSYVMGAQGSKLRFDRIVGGTKDGPIKERLVGLSDRLDSGIEDCWRVASRGDEIDDALKHLSTAEAQLELSRLQQQIGRRQPSTAEASTVQALESQLATAARMRGVSEDANARLRLLDARLDELVAKAVEVSVGAGDSGWLSDEVDGVVGDLEALRLALEDTNNAAAQTMPELPPLGQTELPSAGTTFPPPTQ
jgi:hypothetical protein